MATLEKGFAGNMNKKLRRKKRYSGSLIMSNSGRRPSKVAFLELEDILPDTQATSPPWFYEI